MIIFALENIRSVYNVGSIFRTGEGFGFKHFALVGITPTPFDKYGNKRKDFIKTALGSEDIVTWEYFETTENLFEEYKNFEIISIELSGKSVDLKNISGDLLQNKNYIVVLGSEVEGVSKTALDCSSAIYHIPMHGIKESFNVGVTAGIVMYAIQE